LFEKLCLVHQKKKEKKNFSFCFDFPDQTFKKFAQTMKNQILIP
jgi:hypothetical protein